MLNTLLDHPDNGRVELHDIQFKLGPALCQPFGKRSTTMPQVPAGPLTADSAIMLPMWGRDTPGRRRLIKAAPA